MLAESVAECPIFAPVHSWLSSSSPCLFSPLHKDPIMTRVPVENSSPKFFSEDLRSAARGYTSASFGGLLRGYTPTHDRCVLGSGVLDANLSL